MPDMLAVYYWTVIEDGVATIYTTAKSYFDRHHYLDSGEGRDYLRISEAMEECGAFNTCESMFEAYPEDVGNIIAKMKTLGFDMQENQDLIIPQSY